MCVPTSVCEYYQNKAVRQAVDSLVDALEGKNTPEMNWMEARSYNKALLSAAQVRGDLIEFLFKVWEDSFGQADPGRLNGEIFLVAGVDTGSDMERSLFGPDLLQKWKSG